MNGQSVPHPAQVEKGHVQEHVKAESVSVTKIKKKIAMKVPVRTPQVIHFILFHLKSRSQSCVITQQKYYIKRIWSVDKMEQLQSHLWRRSNTKNEKLWDRGMYRNFQRNKKLCHECMPCRR